MTRLRRSHAVPALAVSLVLLGACSASTPVATKASANTDASSTTAGGGSSKSTTTTGSKSSTTVTTAAPDSTPTTSGGNVHLTGSFCDMIKQFDELDSDIFAPQEGTDPATNLQKLQKSFADTIDAMHQLQAKAPAEIKADVDFAVDAFEQFNDQVQKLTSYSPEAMATITSPDFESPEAQKHNDNLDAYAKDKCGIDPTD